MHADLFEHVAFHGHKGFLEDCAIILIYKTDGADSTRREEYWRTVLKAISPYEYCSLEVPYFDARNVVLIMDKVELHVITIYIEVIPHIYIYIYIYICICTYIYKLSRWLRCFNS